MPHPAPPQGRKPVEIKTKAVQMWTNQSKSQFRNQSPTGIAVQTNEQIAMPVHYADK
jgi:hypothetical protein